MQIIALIMLVGVGIGMTMASPVVSPNIDDRHVKECPCDQSQGDPPFADYCCD